MRVEVCTAYHVVLAHGLLSIGPLVVADEGEADVYEDEELQRAIEEPDLPDVDDQSLVRLVDEEAVKEADEPIEHGGDRGGVATTACGGGGDSGGVRDHEKWSAVERRVPAREVPNANM